MNQGIRKSFYSDLTIVAGYVMGLEGIYLHFGGSQAGPRLVT